MLIEEVVNEMVDKDVFIDSFKAIIAKVKGPEHYADPTSSSQDAIVIS